MAVSFDGNLLVSGKTTCACLFVGRKPNWRLFLEEKLTGGTCVRKHKENNTLRGWPRETKSDCFASLVCQVSKPAIKWCETTGMGPCFFLTPPSNSMGPGGWAPQPKLFSGSKRRKAKAGGVAYKPRSERKPSKLVGHPRKAQHQAGLTICRPCAGFLEVLAKETQRNQFRTRGKHENWFWSQETSEKNKGSATTSPLLAAPKAAAPAGAASGSPQQGSRSEAGPDTEAHGFGQHITGHTGHSPSWCRLVVWLTVSQFHKNQECKSPN